MSQWLLFWHVLGRDIPWQSNIASIKFMLVLYIYHETDWLQLTPMTWQYGCIIACFFSTKSAMNLSDSTCADWILDSLVFKLLRMKYIKEYSDLNKRLEAYSSMHSRMLVTPMTGSLKTKAYRDRCRQWKNRHLQCPWQGVLRPRWRDWCYCRRNVSFLEHD